MISLYKDPDGDGIFHQQSLANATTIINYRAPTTDEIEGLRRKILQMEKEMKKLKV